MTENENENTTTPEGERPEGQAAAAPPEMPEETPTPEGAGGIRQVASRANLDFLLDVPLQVSVELGRCNITIAELLELGKGSVLELDKLAGESLDFRVNGRLVARGEAVVVNDKFGVRLTDIISPSERVSTLK